MQFATVVESLVLEQRHGMAIYSDDRRVRQIARQMGLRSFGTPALLEALVQRDLLSAEQVCTARKRLLRTGAWGLRPTADKLSEVAAEAGFRLTTGLAYALQDRFAWREDSIDTLRATIRFLQLSTTLRPIRLSHGSCDFSTR